MKIEGSVALVTGGVSGLGFGAASRFVRGGGSVVMLDIDEAHMVPRPWMRWRERPVHPL